MYIDPHFNGQIFRQDYPQIIATDRHLAKIIPLRFDYQANPLPPGQCVGVRTVNGYAYPYSAGATGGEQAGVGVLLDILDWAQTGATGSSFGTAASGTGAGTLLGRVVVGGSPLFYGNLVGVTTGFLKDVNARVVTDAAGTQLMVW